jgi:hypothetical protein
MEADLHQAGYEVERCGGPEREQCPVVGSLPCPLVDRSDVLVYDAWVAGDSDGGRRLISELREVYVDLPVILTSAESLDWVEEEGPHRVTPFRTVPSGRLLIDAVEMALTEQGMGV